MKYRIEITDEVDATGPREALAEFLDRVENEETEAIVTHIATGVEHSFEIQTGEEL